VEHYTYDPGWHSSSTLYDTYLHDFPKKDSGILTAQWWYYLENVDPTGDNPAADTNNIMTIIGDRDASCILSEFNTPYGSNVAGHNPDEFEYYDIDSTGWQSTHWLSDPGISDQGAWKGIKLVYDLDGAVHMFDFYTNQGSGWSLMVDDAGVTAKMPETLGTFTFYQLCSQLDWPGPYFNNPDYATYVDDILITWEQSAVPQVPGDANGDGKVTIADFLALQNNFNQAGGWAEGDFNDDGQVTIADFLILQNNWGYGTAGAGSVPTVPEPASMLLLALGGLALVRRREKKTWDS